MVTDEPKGTLARDISSNIPKDWQWVTKAIKFCLAIFKRWPAPHLQKRPQLIRSRNQKWLFRSLESDKRLCWPPTVLEMTPTKFMYAPTKSTYLGQQLVLAPQLLGKHP